MTAFSSKRPALVTTTFLNFEGACFWELQLYLHVHSECVSFDWRYSFSKTILLAEPFFHFLDFGVLMKDSAWIKFWTQA